jgi:hypothetical protein
MQRGGNTLKNLKPQGGDMADTTILQSFVALQERKLRAKVEAIAQGGQMAVNHQVSGMGMLQSSNQDVYDSVYDLKFTTRHGHHHGDDLEYEIIPR